MIDIRTYATSGHISIPFDWQLLKMPTKGELALDVENAFHTAVIISLFSDKRADKDTVLPRGQTDRRGWCGDEVVNSDGDQWGSHLWLVTPSKITEDIEEFARFSAWESLQWLVRDQLAEKIDVSTSWAGESGDRLALRIQIWRSETNIQPDYDSLWATTVRR